jgi:thioredoxin reductase (NADPH)
MPTTRKVIIIGSGPAGYTAAIYAARANLAPLVFTGVQSGGQLMLTTMVENYPGFADGIMGPELMEAARPGRGSAQTSPRRDRRRPGASALEIRATRSATRARRSSSLPGLAKPRPARESQPAGRGVTCATCDGFFFKDQNIMVVGGGDSALEEALYLARLGRKVDVVHRRDSLRASKIMQERAFKNPRIEFLWNRAVEDILDPAQGKVTAVRLRDVVTGERTERAVDGLFVAIGHEPNTRVRGQWISTTATSRWSGARGRPCRACSRRATWGLHLPQAVTAAGSGCMAAAPEAERCLQRPPLQEH